MVSVSSLTRSSMTRAARSSVISTARHPQVILADLTDRYAPATVSVRYQGAAAVLTWAIAEQELDRSP